MKSLLISKKYIMDSIYVKVRTTFLIKLMLEYLLKKKRPSNYGGTISLALIKTLETCVEVSLVQLNTNYNPILFFCRI